MYELNDTIAAVSSPSSERRVIVRVSGPRAIRTVNEIFRPPLNDSARRVITGHLHLEELSIEASLYIFRAPYSYTGQDLVEIHFFSNRAVTELLLETLLSHSELKVRMAEAGEFTARAYLNGKLDLAQAEAVGEIISSSNRFQLAAAKELFSGQLAGTIEAIRSSIVECLSLIEAGLDFSGEDIEFISLQEAVHRIKAIKRELEQLLAGGINFETIVDLPAVAIVGAANAGKSSLVNRLLGTERSIVSDIRKTTRDVLSGCFVLEHCQCVLFDCAGLLSETDNLLDELAQSAAVEAIRKSTLLIFCIDGSKQDFAEDRTIFRLIENNKGEMAGLLATTTKMDLIPEIDKSCDELNDLFGLRFFRVSNKTGSGIEQLKRAIDDELVRATAGDAKEGFQGGYSVALTIRHRHAVVEAMDNLAEAAAQMKAGNDEVAVMFLRSAYQQLSGIQQPQVGDIDEQILSQIFSRFCIGK